MEASYLVLGEKKLVDVNDPSNMNKRAQWLLAPVLAQTYADLKVEVSTPKFDQKMHADSKLLRAERKKAREQDHRNQCEFIEICHEINSMQKQVYANNNEHVKVIDAHSKPSAKRKLKSPSPKPGGWKVGEVEIVDLSDLTFELNYKDEYIFDRHKASTVQRKIRKARREKKRRDRENATKEQLANFSSSETSSSDDGAVDAARAAREKPSMKNLIRKLEMKEQQEIGESIQRYKKRLAAEKKLTEKQVKQEELLENDILEGKYPELAERRDDLHHLYRTQKMRDLKKTQQEKVKSLSQMHLQRRTHQTDDVPLMKKSSGQKQNSLAARVAGLQALTQAKTTHHSHHTHEASLAGTGRSESNNKIERNMSVKKDFATLQPIPQEADESKRKTMATSKTTLNQHGRKGLAMLQKKYKASATQLLEEPMGAGLELEKQGSSKMRSRNQMQFELRQGAKTQAEGAVAASTMESQPSLSKIHSMQASKRGAAASQSPIGAGEVDPMEQNGREPRTGKKPSKHVPTIDLSNPKLIFDQLASNYASNAKPKALQQQREILETLKQSETAKTMQSAGLLTPYGQHRDQYTLPAIPRREGASSRTQLIKSTLNSKFTNEQSQRELPELALGSLARGDRSSNRPIHEIYQSEYTKNVEEGKYFRTVESDGLSTGDYASTRDRSKRHRSTMKPSEKSLAPRGSQTRSYRQLPGRLGDAALDPRSKGRRDAMKPAATELQGRVDGMKVKIIEKNIQSRRDEKERRRQEIMMPSEQKLQLIRSKMAVTEKDHKQLLKERYLTEIHTTEQQRVREIEIQLEKAGQKKLHNPLKGAGLQLRNKNFVMNFDFKNKQALEDFKADFETLKLKLKHNPYDPAANSEDQRRKRTLMFEDLLAKHAQMREPSDNSSDNSAQKEGGEMYRRAAKANLKRINKIVHVDENGRREKRREKISFINIDVQARAVEARNVDSDEGKGPGSKEDSEYSSDEQEYGDEEAQVEEGGGSIKDSQTEPLYQSSSSFDAFRQEQALVGGDCAEPFEMFQSRSSEGQAEIEEAAEQPARGTEKQPRKRLHRQLQMQSGSLGSGSGVESMSLHPHHTHDSTRSRQAEHTEQQNAMNSHHMVKYKKYLQSQRQEKYQDLTGETIKDPVIQYFIDADKKHMVPRDLGFITKKSNPYRVDIADRYLRMDYVAAFCQGIRVGDLIQELNLRNASLSTDGAMQIISAMQYKNIKLLDFSSNRSIQEGFFEQLGGMFTKPDFKLEVLHLENVDINESTAKKFLKDVTENRTLKVLNLSRNNLTDASVAPICEVLDQCQSLDSLYLHYNKIFGKGGMQIAEALEHNGNLQILDISFNALNGGIISKDQKQRSKLMASFAEAWAKCFKNNESLVHMDISHNNLNWDQMEIIGEGLRTNHTIMGLHVKGNQADVDSLGFIQPVSDITFQTKVQMLQRIQTSKDAGPHQAKKLDGGLSVGENCWICEGWSPVHFHYTPGISDDRVDLKKGEAHDVHIAINLHLDCDNFLADLVMPQPVQEFIIDVENADNEEERKEIKGKKQVYISKRMVPPGEHQYFFSIAGKQILARDQKSIKLKKREKVEVKSAFFPSKKQTELQESMNMDFEITTLPALNCVTNVPMKKFDYDRDRLKELPIRPRVVKRLGTRASLRTPWLFNKSAFSQYRPDSHSLLNDCFEYDWQFIITKVEYLIKQEKERAAVKAYLKENYKLIRDAYKQAAGQDCVGNVMAVTGASFLQLMQSCGDLVDGDSLKLADVDLGKVAVKAADKQKKPNKLCPVDRIIRYNFLEVHVRLAEQKFIKSKRCDNFVDAMRIYIEDYCAAPFKSIDAHIWRKRMLWQEDCDLAIKRQYRTVQKLYEKYSGKFAKTSTQKFVSPTEFADMVQDSGVLNDRFSRNEVFPVWNLAMMTQVDEINNDRHLNMSFTEFIEAICRVADKLSFPDVLKEFEKRKDPSYIPTILPQETTQPLPSKIQSFLLICARSCFSQAYFAYQAIPALQSLIKDDLLANHISVSGTWRT